MHEITTEPTRWLAYGELIALATRLDDSAHLLAWPDGRLGGPAAAGPGGSCVCPSCGHRAPHVVSEPYYQKKCPKCGTQMARE